MTCIDQTRKRFRLAIIVVAAASLAYGQHFPKLSTELEGLDPEAAVNVIIQYKHTPEQRHIDAVVRTGGRHLGTLGLVHGAVFSVPAKALAGLANDPEVVLISPDHKVAAMDVSGTPVSTVSSLAVNTPDYGWMSLLGLSSPSAKAAYDGTGIGVAVIDSGIRSSNDFNTAQGTSRVVYNQSFVLGDSTTNDAYGHGTHVAGLVAGDGYNSRTFASSYVIRGLVPNVNLLNLRVLDQNGTDSAVIAAIQRAIALQSQFNIGVINLSLGRPVSSSYTTDPLCQAVESAWQAGIVVVVAAGNDGRDNSAGTAGYGTITAPGNDPYVITVGAMNTEGTLARCSITW